MPLLRSSLFSDVMDIFTFISILNSFGAKYCDCGLLARYVSVHHCHIIQYYFYQRCYDFFTFLEQLDSPAGIRVLASQHRHGQPRWLSGLRRSRVHSLWLLVDHCVLRNWDRILVRAVKGLISRAGMVSICPLLWQRDVKLQQTNRRRRSPAVACWASDHWVARSNPLRGKFRH